MRERTAISAGFIALMTAACSHPQGSQGVGADGGASAPGPSSARETTVDPGPTRPDGPADEAVPPLRLRLTVGELQLTGSLRDTAAARDLVAQLPLTLRMSDHGGVEKTGALPAPLSLAGQPEGADPDPGDLGYYAPSGDLVLYYGDQGYYPGIVRLGTLHGDVAAIAGYDDVTVRVDAAGA